MPAEPFIELVARIDALEIQLRRDLLSSDKLLSDEDLLQVLSRVGRSVLATEKTAQGLSTHRLNLSAAIRRIIETEFRRENRPGLLTIRQATLIQLVGAVFHYLEYSCDLDPDIYAAIEPIQVDLAAVAIVHPETLGDGTAPPLRFLELLVKVCKGFDRHSGSRAAALVSQAAGCVREALASELPKEQAYRDAERHFITFLKGYNRETGTYDKRLIKKERGQTQRDDARLLVNREIMQAVAGKRLPQVILRFLTEVWNKYLYVTHLRHGMDSPEWQQGIEDIRTLVDSLAIRDRDEMFHLYRDRLSKTLARLTEGAGSIHHDEVLIRAFFETVDAVHLQILQGGEVEMPEPVNVPLQADGDATGSRSVLAEKDAALVDGLRIGEWFRLLDFGLEIRCRLIEKSPENGYCLFANYSGIKSARYDLQKTAAALKSGTLKRLDTAPVFPHALAYALEQLATFIPRLEARVEESVQARAEALERQRAAERAEQLRILEERRQLEQEKALEEARRRAEEEAREAAERRQAEAREARIRAELETLPDVYRLQPGARLELISAEGKRLICSLGLKLKSSGKLIFIDHFGKKIAEFLPEELARQIVDGNAAIVDYGVAFDDTLRSLIEERSDRLDSEQVPDRK